MKFLILVYIDAELMSKLSEIEFSSHMKACLNHADALKAAGTLESFQQLEPATTAKSVRVRAGRTTIVDGPFAETKEVLGGYNVIEADSMEDALRIAQEFPWTKYGCLEVRPVRDIAAMRKRVGA